VSLPLLRVTVVQLSEKLPHDPFERLATSRWRMLVVPSTPEPPSLPPFFVTATELLV
jgi:hypothetical protein